jgi:VIT1/CCC1 family predicted Fe2+/Mn2+ transporter
MSVSRARAKAAATEFDSAWLAEHLARERHEASILSEVREALFGCQDGLTSVLAVVSTVGGATGQPYAVLIAGFAAMQDGLTSVLAVVSTVGGATGQPYAVLIAGFAAMLAGIFSMAAGEYMSSKSQREIFEAQIASEAEEVDERPGEAEAEVAYMLEEEGLSPEAAGRVARELASSKPVLLKTMVEKELGLSVEDDVNALRGALVMGAAFGIGGLVPILPYLFLDVHSAVYVSVGLAAVTLFGMGVLKSRFTQRNWFRSGLEIFALGAFAGIAGYFFGTLLPAALGVAGIAS